MKLPGPLGLRARLLLFVLIAVAPVIGITVYNALEQERAAEFILGLFALVCVALVWIGGNLFLLRPIDQLVATVRQMRRLNEELERCVVERTAQLEAANEELEALSYSVSHDLRAPLRHIDGFSKLMLERSGGADERTAHYLRTIANSAKRMGRLIDDLLALSRTGRAEIRMQDVDLNDLMSDARRECAEGAQGRDIAWKVGELPHVTGDRALLRIVLVNLLSNALKFTSKRDAAIIEVGASRGENGEAVVCVRDNGAGFDMRYADKLFGVFQRLHREDEFEGTGVGLATVRRIVHRLGGRVWAQGETGRGAAFYVALKTAPE